MVVSFVILIAGLQAMKTINVRQYPRSDIAAITVNRWGHGYSYDMDPVFDDPRVSAREMRASITPVGRIHFAGTDAAWQAYAHKAIDAAQRAAAEIAG